MADTPAAKVLRDQRRARGHQGVGHVGAQGAMPQPGTWNTLAPDFASGAYMLGNTGTSNVQWSDQASHATYTSASDLLTSGK